MANASPARKALAVSLVALIVFQAGAGLFIGLASADIGSEGCYDDAGTAILSPWTAVTVAYDNYKDPCWKETAVSDDELTNLNENQTYEKVVTVIDTRSNEERLIETMLTNPEFSKEPVRQRAELEFANEYINNSTETESITAARNAIKDEYNVRLKGLALRYNRDARNARNAYSRLDSVNATSHMHVYVNGSEVDTSGGITFSVPVDQNDTANGTTYTLPNTDTVRIATVSVNGTAYDFRQDDLAITMADPATGGDEVPILGRDISHKYGADAYDPADEGYSASTADIVIAADGSGDYTTIGDGLAAANDSFVVFVKSGTYNTTGVATEPEVSAPNVTVVADGAIVTGDYGVQSSADNVSFKGFVLRDISNDEPIRRLSTTGYLGEVAYNTIHGGVKGSSIYQYAAAGPETDIHHNYIYKDGGNNAEIYVNNFPNGAEVHDNLLPDSTRPGDYHASNEFGVFNSFTSQMIVEQEADRDEILAAFGDSTAGYLHDVWNKLQTDTLAITDILTFDQMFSQSFSEEDIGSRAWLDAQYMQAGMSSHDLQSTVIVEVQSNATVYAGAKKSGATTLSSAKTYEGHLWTMNPPASGTWETNKTYDTATLGGPLYITHYQQKETLNADGSISVKMVPATVAVEGEFRLNDLINKNGTSVTNISHSEPTSNDPYNASEYNQKIQTLNTRINELNEQIQSDGGGGSTSGACIVDLPLIGCIESLSMSLFGGLVVLVGVYAFATKGIPGILAALLGKQ